MEDHLTPLAKVPEYEFDGYLTALDNILDQRIEEMPDPNMHYTDFSIEGRKRRHTDVYAMERAVYNRLANDLEDIDSKTELFNYVEQQVSFDSLLPEPLDILTRPIDRLFEGERKRIFQSLFEEAKEEFQEPGEVGNLRQGFIQSSP